MLNVMAECFPEKFENEWKSEIVTQIPAYGIGLNHEPALAAASLAETAEVLGLHAPTAQTTVSA